MSHLRTVLPDGRLAITTLASTLRNKDRAIAKTMFELSRDWLTPPEGLTPTEIEDWRRSVHFDAYTGQVLLSCRECDDSELPTNRSFRDAWEDTGTMIRVNMPKARGIWMDVIRLVRNAALLALDPAYMKALESGDAVEQKRIATQKRYLRQIPQTFDLTTPNDTPEELKAMWPTNLPREASRPAELMGV